MVYVNFGDDECAMQLNFTYESLARVSGFFADLLDEFRPRIAAAYERSRRIGLELGRPALEDTADSHMVVDRQHGMIRVLRRVNSTDWQQMHDAYELFLARERGEVAMPGGWYVRAQQDAPPQ
jgi:hypothetical protein